MIDGPDPARTGSDRILDGPYFDDLSRGDVFASSPALTLTAAHAAAHQAITGDRLRLCLDHELSLRVAGEPAPVAHPGLVWDTAIGQSSEVTRGVVANLFYRGLSFHRLPTLGDTIRTRTEVVALRQNRARAGRRNTGLVLLRIRTLDQHQRSILDFRRCAMLPLRDQNAVTGHNDDVVAASSVDEADVPSANPIAGWRLDVFRADSGGDHFAQVRPGTSIDIAAGDVVSCAPELARLTLNIAAVHHDESNSDGRLVYGGHTVGLALAQANRAIPNLVTVLGWQGCDHLAPVREGDTLHSRISIDSAEPLDAGGGLVRLRSQVRARGRHAAEDTAVLDWRFTALMA